MPKDKDPINARCELILAREAHKILMEALRKHDTTRPKIIPIRIKPPENKQ